MAFCVTVGIQIHICRYKIRGDDEEWEEVLKKAGGTAVVSIKRCSTVKGSSVYSFYECNISLTSNSDKKRKLDGGSLTASNGSSAYGKLKKKDTQHGKFKKNKDRRGQFGKKP